jgi:hypothetical protein
MASITKWEYLTAWRYTVMEGGEGMFQKGVPVEVLEVKGEGVEDFEHKLDELGAHGWELVTETPHVSEVEPPLFQALTAFDSTTKGRVRTHGYTLVFKRPIDEAEAKEYLAAIEADDD